MNSAVLSRTAGAMPVDKGGLNPPPPSPRQRLQRVCYGIAAGFALLGAASLAAVDVAFLIVVAIPVTFFSIAGLALGLAQPSLRQRLMLWSVGLTALAAVGMAMMPLHAGPVMEAVRGAGFAFCAATTVLCGLCGFLPPYSRDKAGKGDGLLRFVAVVFCGCTGLMSYLSVVMVCTPAGY